MKFMLGTKTITVLLIFQVIGLNSMYFEPTLVSCETHSTDPSLDPYNILFIGSSYFNFNNLPGLFKNLADTAGKDIIVDSYAVNGLYLSDHASSTVTEDKINQELWDYVILQGVGSLTAYPENMTDHPVYPSLVTLKKKIIANCNTTKMVFCLPWAFEDGMTWKDGWTDTYVDMQRIIYEKTLQYSYEIGFVVAPVGWAWNTVLQEKNYPTHYLHLSDWNHPSLEGSYLMACVVYSTVFQENSTEIPYYSTLQEANAQYFQTIATSTVLTNISVWNPDGLISSSSNAVSESIPGFDLGLLVFFSLVGLGFLLFRPKKHKSISP